MTALNIMSLGDAAVIFQDRATYDYEDGVIDDLLVKSVISDDGRWAMGFMGNGYNRPAAKLVLSAMDFDTASDHMSDYLQRVVAFASAKGDVEPSAAIVLAGWSERDQRIIAWYAQSWGWSGAEPFERIEVHFLLNPPPFIAGRKLELSSDDVQLNWSVIGALECGRRLMELQRIPMPPSGHCDMPEWSWKKSVVGGGCDATIVTKDEVKRITLADWPDAIGDGPEVRRALPTPKVEILKAKPPAHAAPISRAERRRAAREERRAA